MLQSKPDIDRRIEIHAVAGDGVVCLRQRLHPQVIEKDFVPRPKEVDALVLQLAWVEHGAAAETFPQDSDLAAGNRNHHVREEHHAHERRDHQEDHHARQMALDEPPPSLSDRRRGRPPIH